ncbi:MAG: putative aminohydrolase SsnA [Bacteroidetes bacterium]|nr:MAG: putative aminohydrolase SsnA [Bacteroidota bacterium]
MLLKNCTLLTFLPSAIEKADLRIENGFIVERKKNLVPKRNEEVINLEGKYILPGLVNAHTHLYSTLARGMRAPRKQPKNFLEILQLIWWKLDRALDDESIYYSALAGAIEAAQCGTTTLVDHHASPKAIKGSLDIIKQALEEVGLRGMLCYEVTDRGGMKERDAGLLENERFISTNRNNTMCRGLVGAHASFTLGNESLRLLGEMAERTNSGVHIHVAEDTSDCIDAEENYRCSVIERLEKNHILRRDSILAHCIHLGRPEIKNVQKHRSWFVHNPRSNMNNFVGHAPVHLLGERVALGTDGFPADMFEEARTGFFKNRDMRYEIWDVGKKFQVSGFKSQGKMLEGRGSKFEKEQIHDVNLVGLLQGGQRLVSEIFKQDFGGLEKGSLADLLVLDYQSPTPMTKENLGGHFLFGMRSSMVESVMVNGKWIVWNRELPGVDVQSVIEKSAKIAKRLWEKM